MLPSSTKSEVGTQKTRELANSGHRCSSPPRSGATSRARDLPPPALAGHTSPTPPWEKKRRLRLHYEVGGRSRGGVLGYGTERGRTLRNLVSADLLSTEYLVLRPWTV